MAEFVGFVSLEDTIEVCFLARSGDTPMNAASLPTYRIYGPQGLLATGSAAYKDSGTVTGATNANPIVITSVAHGLNTGTRVTVTGVLGNTAANTTAAITVITADTFSLNSTTGNGAYTSGGTWNVTGAYKVEVPALAASGYDSNQNYVVIVAGTVNSVAWGTMQGFGVV